MTETVSTEANEWNDTYVTDELFGAVTKGLFWGGFAILTMARLVIAILVLSLQQEGLAEVKAMGGEVAGQLGAMMTFFFIETIGTLIFSSALVVGALATGRAPSWARVTMICVAALAMLGSNALASLFLWNAL